MEDRNGLFAPGFSLYRRGGSRFSRVGGRRAEEIRTDKAEAAAEAGKRPIIISAANGFDYLDEAFTFLKAAAIRSRPR